MAAVEAQLKADADAVINEAMMKIQVIQAEARRKMGVSLANARTKIALIKATTSPSGESYRRMPFAEVRSPKNYTGIVKKLRTMLHLL